MSDIEAAWYKYARCAARISGGHRNACQRAGGASGTPALLQGIRWPGYLGSHYSSSSLRVLCVGQVHNAADLLATLGAVQGDLARLASGALDDTGMSRLTRAYERAIVKWGPWTKFSKILTPLGIDETQIAYTNVAKCWQTLSEKPDCRGPMRACAAVFPLGRLAEAIKAHVVLVMSADSTLRYAGVSSSPVPMFSFPGRPSDAQLAEIAKALYNRFVR